MAISRWLGTSLREQERKILLLLLALSLVRGVFYSAVIPPWQAPDEPKHFEYVRLVFEKRRPITIDDSSLSLQEQIISSMLEYDFWRFGRGAFRPQAAPQTLVEIWPDSPTMLYAPPLYYLLSALFQVFTPDTEIVVQLYAARLVSVILGMLTILVAFLTTREIFPGDNFLIIGVPTFITFLPMYTFISSSVINDNLANLLTLSIIYLITVSLRRGLSLFKMLGIAFLIVLGLLTKRTTFFTIPVAMVAIPLHLWKKMDGIAVNWRRGALMALFAAMGIGLGILMSSELQTRFVHLFQVSIEAFYRYAFYNRGQFLAILRSLSSPDSLVHLIFFMQRLFESFWAHFGWLRIGLAAVWYQLIAGICLAASIGFLKFVFGTMRRPNLLASWQKKCLLLFSFSVILVLVITIGFFSAFLFPPHMVPPQGRYLFPVIVPIATIFMIGLGELVPKQYRQALLLASMSGFILFDSFCLLRYVIPFFYR